MSEQQNWEEFKKDYARRIEENNKLKGMYDNLMDLYHRTIDNHETMVSIHAIGDELLKVGELKEVKIIE